MTEVARKLDALLERLLARLKRFTTVALSLNGNILKKPERQGLMLMG
jgi:hypothetical protein